MSHHSSSTAFAPPARTPRLPVSVQQTRSTSCFLKENLVAPRAGVVAQRFPGNVRVDEFEDLLGAIWSHIRGCSINPIQTTESHTLRAVTFMGAVRFTVHKYSRRVTVSQYGRQGDKVEMAQYDNATVIDLPVRIDGFWLDAFLVPWMGRIADCLIDHRRPGPGPDWFAAIKLELQRAAGRSTHWQQVRWQLRDALQLDPQILLWCRKGRPTYRNYVTQRFYNSVLSDRANYQRIQDDNPNLVWLYNFLCAEEIQPKGDQPVANMKAWLLSEGVSEAGWRLVANGKEQDFRHIIDFIDADGGIEGRHSFLAKWVRMLCKMRRGRPVPRPLTGMFEHDTYDGGRTELGDRVRFRDVAIQPGVLRSVLEEGERRLARGSHQSFIQDEVVEVMTWLQREMPVLDKNQLRRGWKYLAEQAVSWKVECEAMDTLKDLTWVSLLPETQIGAWTIVPLTDAWQLRHEAMTRRHCADQYLEQCVNGQARLFSVRNALGKSVATIGIELKGLRWSIFGFRGFANQPVSAALFGVDKEVLKRYTDLWSMMVPRSKPLPPALDHEDGFYSESICPYCGESEKECAHVVAVRDTISGELIGGALYSVFEDLSLVIEEEIRYAVHNGGFRIAVTEEVQLLAYHRVSLQKVTNAPVVAMSDRGHIRELIVDRLERCPKVMANNWEFMDGAPGTATIYRCFWARDTGAVVGWLKAQFSPSPAMREI